MGRVSLRAGTEDNCGPGILPPAVGTPVGNKEEGKVGSETRKTKVGCQQTTRKDLLETEMTKKELWNSRKEAEKHKRKGLGRSSGLRFSP